jgi:RNA polymerase sigma factor (sigma-70 family)
LTASTSNRSAADICHAALTSVFREQAGALHSSLMRWLQDFAMVEEVVQDAVLLALQHWPTRGIPRRPGAWLLAVSRRLAMNRLAREANFQTKVTQVEPPEPHEPDDRLRLIFTCCHPALARDAQIALTLRTVCGLTTPEIARALVISEAAVQQRIVRVRRKIADAGIPYAVPADERLPERLDEVLAVLYLMFNEGHLASQSGTAFRRDLADDASWLAALVAQLLPKEPEPLGLVALMKLHLARADARFDETGRLILLHDQDRGRWNRPMIDEAIALIERAAAAGRPGPYQVEAAIAACHAEAASYAATDWAQILALYDLLLQLAPSPVVLLHRAVALREVAGPDDALAEVNRLADVLDGYHLFHAIRGELLLELGQRELAGAAQQRAFGLARNEAERSLLLARLDHRTPES